jgi:5-methylcytosine-specific restriction endonuclease McrA
MVPDGRPSFGKLRGAEDSAMTESTDILSRQALVLNRNWHPIHVTTVVRALVMLWNESARVVDHEDYRLYTWDEWAGLPPRDGAPCIRTGRARLRVPEVVALIHYDRVPLSTVSFSRRNVAKRDHHTCQYCGSQPGVDELTIDHILPRSQGGVSSWTNCVAACVLCNARKADRTPEQAGMRLRKLPVRPDWKPFIALIGTGQGNHGHRPPAWTRFLPDEQARVMA